MSPSVLSLPPLAEGLAAPPLAEVGATAQRGTPVWFPISPNRAVVVETARLRTLRDVTEERVCSTLARAVGVAAVPLPLLAVGQGPLMSGGQGQLSAVVAARRAALMVITAQQESAAVGQTE